eukprot:208544_1
MEQIANIIHLMGNHNNNNNHKNNNIYLPINLYANHMHIASNVGIIEAMEEINGDKNINNKYSTTKPTHHHQPSYFVNGISVNSMINILAFSVLNGGKEYKAKKKDNAIGSI